MFLPYILQPRIFRQFDSPDVFVSNKKTTGIQGTNKLQVCAS